MDDCDNCKKLRVESDELRDIIKALRVELDAQRAKYKRDLSNHSCNSGGGPDMCGGCCECMERQFHNEPPQEDIDALRATIKRVEALTDDVDSKYSLVDDNSADEHRGQVRLFLALDDVRAALKGGA